MFCPLLPSLLHGRRRRTNAKMLKIHWFLWVASHMRLFSGSARSNQISEGTRSKKRLNISSKMRTQGTNIDVQKKHFLRPKWLLLKRVRKTVGDSSAQKGLLDASGAVKKKRKPYLKVVGGDSCFPKGGRVRGGKGRDPAGSRDRSPRLPGEAHLSKKSS